MSKKLVLWMVAVACSFAMQGAAYAQIYAGIDHMTCYKIKDNQKIAAMADLLSYTFNRATGSSLGNLGADFGCKVSSAKLLCMPTAKVLTSLSVNKVPTLPLPLVATDEREFKLCYKIKCSSSVALYPNPFTVVDQFATHSVTRGSAGYLCTPAIDQFANTGYCGDGIVNGSEECDVGVPGAACTNPTASCEEDCRCHGATACCYADVIPLPGTVGCLQYYGSQSGADAFVNECNTGFDLSPGVVSETGSPGACTMSPMGGTCTAANTLNASGTP
jgi:hypothetical protein